MKTKRLILEAAGIILALSGAFLLVFSLMPLINPGFTKLNLGDLQLFSVGDTLCLALAVVIIICGILCSLKAGRLKKQEKSGK